MEEVSDLRREETYTGMAGMQLGCEEDFFRPSSALWHLREFFCAWKTF